MKQAPEEHDFLMKRFDNWLQITRVDVRPGFLSRVRERLDENSTDLDEVLDSLLQPDPQLRVQNMADRVRIRLNGRPAQPEAISWFKWITPLAAAATLTLAFMSFQIRAPKDIPALAGELDTPSAFSVSPQPDSELTRIFALAANLHGSANVSDLQSVDNLALLFE